MAELARRRAKATAGLGASVALHLVLATAALLSFSWKGPPPDQQALEVSLIPLPRPAPSRPRGSPKALAAPAALSAAPAPSSTGTVPSPITAPTSTAAAPGAGDDQGRARLAGLLRGSFGCTETKFLKLSQKEQDRCARWRQAQAKPGLEIPAPIEAHKRAWFDATVAARNAPDHPPGLVCFGKPPHGIKLGPLPCYVEPPKGPFSQDVDAPPEPGR